MNARSSREKSVSYVTPDPVLILRYFAALSVMLLHFSGIWFGAHEWAVEKAPLLMRIRNFTLLFPGVVILFSLSGYFIAGSLQRLSEQYSSWSQVFRSFMGKRIRRIYPPLWLNTVFNLAVLSLTGHAVIRAKDVAVWFFAQLLGISATPGSLKAYASGSVNGALWTIFVQMQFYLLFVCLYPLVRKKDRSFLACLLGIAFLVNIAAGILFGGEPSGIIGKLVERSFLPYVIWFLIGAACRLLRHSIFAGSGARNLPAVFTALYLLISFGMHLTGIVVPGYYTNAVTGVFVSLITGLLCVRYAGSGSGRRKTLPDISYELFLYHWIVLNVMISAGMITWSWGQALVVFLLLSFAVSLTAFFVLKQLMR